MADPLLLTKVSLPMLRPTLVAREKVLKQLRQGIQDGHLLTLVSAPAGYGKTTTIRMWAEEAGYPVAWVTLEKSDNDLRQFLTYVLAALQRAEDELGQAALEAVENSADINLPRVLSLLVNDLLGLDRPLVLVLEEYHLIENKQIDQFIEALLNQAVVNLHVIIATREDPSLPITRLRVRNQLTEIRAADLSFSLEEAGEFFANVMRVNLPKRELKILKNRTEGWAAGLQLAALSLKESADSTHFVEALRGTHRHILDYLIEEVIDSQPEAIRAFLRRTSILDQLSPALCAAVTGQQDSTQLLHYLETNNLFLIALDEERTWYRYHALFGELLSNQLLQAEPDRAAELHARAAEWYQQHGFIQKAVEHAFHAGNSSAVPNLIEKYALPMLYQGEVATVVGWFDRLPEALLHTSPLLCIAKAWSLALLQRQTRLEEVPQALQAADHALASTDADQAARDLVAGHTASIQAYLLQTPALASETPAKLIETSQRAQRLLPAGEKAIRSVNALNIGHGYAALADLPAAERAFQQAFEEGIAGGNFYAAIYGPINLVTLALAKGQLQDAFQSCTANITRFNRLLAGQRFPPIGALHVLKGSILLEENRLVEAEAELTQGLSLIRWTGEYEAYAGGYAALARLRCIQGDATGMAENLQALEETRPEVALCAQALRHRLSAHHGAANQTGLEEARRWLTQPDVSFDHLPDITGVDPLARIYFQTYLCAAHTLARLAAYNSATDGNLPGPPQGRVPFRNPLPVTEPLPKVHTYLARQEKFAESHGLVGWLVELWLVRALLYQAEGKVAEARRMMQSALRAAAPRGYLRVFLDEGDLLRPLLEAAELRRQDDGLAAFVQRLLEAMPQAPAKSAIALVDEERLSDRELDVLRLLAVGQSYKEIGEQLFLSLNTVQFHIKNIYGKLLVNKRGQAIEKARAMQLI
ncbi:MAG: LuxR C-terminal-related transcriptional regulator [Caldilineaceae bacterium]